MLRDTLQQLAATFVDDVLATIRGSSLSDFSGSTIAVPAKAPRRAAVGGEKAAKAGRLKRRSAEQVAETVARVADLLKKHPEGLRSEQIRKALALDVREVPRVIKECLASKAFVVLSGQKRSTTYGVRGKVKARRATKAKASK